MDVSSFILKSKRTSVKEDINHAYNYYLELEKRKEELDNIDMKHISLLYYFLSPPPPAPTVLRRSLVESWATQEEELDEPMLADRREAARQGPPSRLAKLGNWLTGR